MLEFPGIGCSRYKEISLQSSWRQDHRRGNLRKSKIGGINWRLAIRPKSFNNTFYSLIEMPWNYPDSCRLAIVFPNSATQTLLVLWHYPHPHPHPHHRHLSWSSSLSGSTTPKGTSPSQGRSGHANAAETALLTSGAHMAGSIPRFSHSSKSRRQRQMQQQRHLIQTEMAQVGIVVPPSSSSLASSWLSLFSLRWTLLCLCTDLLLWQAYKATLIKYGKQE